VSVLYLAQIGTLALIQTLLATGLNLVMGYAGRVSFGQAAIFGGAAYGVAIATVRFGMTPLAAAAVGMAVALGLGLLFAVATLRARGVYFLLTTLALGQVVWGLAYRWVSLTGGDNGLPGVPRPGGGIVWSFADDRGFFLLALIVCAAGVGLMYLLTESPAGYALRGVRDSESRMRTLGYNVELYHASAVVIAALYAGAAGVLYAFYNGFVSPQDLHVSVSADAVLTVILGGSGTVLGPALGAVAMVLLENWLSSVTSRWSLILGVLYILVVLYAPRGLAGLRLKGAARRVSPAGR